MVRQRSRESLEKAESMEDLVIEYVVDRGQIEVCAAKLGGLVDSAVLETSPLTGQYFPFYGRRQRIVRGR